MAALKLEYAAKIRKKNRKKREVPSRATAIVFQQIKVTLNKIGNR